jgi:hypothetical protein
MPLANREQLKTYLSGQLESKPNDLLDIYLDQGAESVKAHSFPVSHPRFAELQMCYTAHLLLVNGLILRPVISESADGISASYAADSSDNGSPGDTRYLIEFKRKKSQIYGLSGRLY